MPTITTATIKKGMQRALSSSSSSLSTTTTSTSTTCSSMFRHGRQMLLNRRHHHHTNNKNNGTGFITLIATNTMHEQSSYHLMMQQVGRWRQSHFQLQQRRMLSFEAFFAEQSRRRGSSSQNHDSGDVPQGNTDAIKSSSSSSPINISEAKVKSSTLSQPPYSHKRHPQHQQQQQEQQQQQQQQYNQRRQQQQQHHQNIQSPSINSMPANNANREQLQLQLPTPASFAGINNRSKNNDVTSGFNQALNNQAVDIRDISQLRNTFLKHPDHHHRQQKPTTTWRGSNAATASSPGSSADYSGRQQRQGVYAMGTRRWTPSTSSSSSFDDQKTTTQFPIPQQLSSSSSSSSLSPTSFNTTIENTSNKINNGIKSMEQIMKENAAQRQQSMEQRYVNAGQRVPYNSDEYGNILRQNNTKGAGGGMPSASSLPSWRHRSNDGGGGGGGRNWNNYNSGRGHQQQQQYQQQQSQSSGQGWQKQPPPRPTTSFPSTSSFQNKHIQRKQQRQRQQIRNALPSSVPKEVRLPTAPLTLVDLSLLLRVRKRTIVRTLRSLGEPIAYSAANQDSYTISVEMMEYICIELGLEAMKVERRESDLEMAERRARRAVVGRGGGGGKELVDESTKTAEEERYASLPPRSPVVSIMGHVDHGKTTLMDALRRRAVTGMSMNNITKGSTTKVDGKKSDKKQQTTATSPTSTTSTSAKSRGKGGVNVTDGNVAGTEAGGITQVITAFEVPLPLDEDSYSQDDEEEGKQSISTVTFLDTPGHAAFKKMRQSGSLATDVIVLVVAADDGVSPQTVEIIEMFKSIARSQPQSISLVIAVSKIDKPGIDIDESVTRIENQLMEHEIYTENVLAGGGDEGEFGACQLFPVSGITGEGLDDLVEGLALQSEIMDLRADEDAKGEGIVIDARMEKGLGVVADCVIRWGSVSKGDFVVSGTNGGRVKFLNDVGNKPLAKARPSQPVRIVGFKTLPKAGDPIVCAKSEDEAKELIRLRESELINEERAEYENEMKLQIMGTAAKQGTMMQKAQQKYGFDNDDGDKKDDSIWIPVVIKADSHGSLEAVRDALVSIGTDSKLNIVIDPVEMSTGVVTTSDVVMARESDAAIFTFGAVGVADKETKNLAENDGVSIRNHSIIYRLLEDAKDFFTKYLPIQLEEKIHGRANVQAVFDVTDTKKQSVSIAGLRVADGYLFKSKSKPGSVGEAPLPCFYRVLRNGKLISPDVEKLQASSLRKVKEDVESVKKGEECGLGLTGFNELVEGDIVECFSIEEKRASI